MIKKNILRGILIVVLVTFIIFFFVAAKMADHKMNVSVLKDMPTVSQKVKDIHSRLTIADWHSDNLLWDRNLLKRINHGHVDLPRLIEGNYTLQVFDAVVKSPKGQNYQSNTGDTDNITLLAIGNRWPIRTWGNLTERCIYQSEALHKAADNSNGQLSIVKSKTDLKSFLNSRAQQTAQVAGLLSIEGLHALEKDIENIDYLYDHGYRMMGLTHFFDNEVGGSSAGIKQGGLTDLGRQVIKRMNDKSIIIDLAHASRATIDEVLAMTTRPVVVSHTGVVGTCDSPRNLSDAHIKGIAVTGGMIGIGFWDGAVCGMSVDHIISAMKYVIDLVGIDHVCLGSDFDGSVTTLFDASQIILLTEGLVKAEFSEAQINQIMGANQINFLLSNLPE